MAPIQSTALNHLPFFPTIRLPYLGRYAGPFQKVVIVTLAIFGAYKILRPLYERYAPFLIAQAYGWQVIEDPHGLEKAKRLIQGCTSQHINRLQSAIQSQRPVPVDGLARQIATLCPEHKEVGLFYRELKGHISQILMGVASVAGGSAARAPNTTGDAAASVSNGAAGLIAFIPLFGPPLAGTVRAAAQGLAWKKGADEGQALSRAAKLCSDSQEISLAAQLIAAHITSRCAKSVATLSQKGAEDLALHTADSFRCHILYKWNVEDSPDASSSWTPLDLAAECKQISQAITGDSNETELEVKAALKTLNKTLKVMHILQLGLGAG